MIGQNPPPDRESRTSERKAEMAQVNGGCILVVANRTCPCPDVLDDVCGRAEAHGSDIVIVAPALNTRLRHYVSDVDGAVAEARARLQVAIEGLAERGVEARGEVGDADPVQAIEDLFNQFTPVEIVISTYPPERSNWLERNVVDRARKRFDVPVTHIVSRYGLGNAANVA